MLIVNIYSHYSTVTNTHTYTVNIEVMTVTIYVLQYYYQGVYSSSQCSSSSVNHAMVVTGYDSTGGSDYWLVKNRYSHIIYTGERPCTYSVYNSSIFPLNRL